MKNPVISYRYRSSLMRKHLPRFVRHVMLKQSLAAYYTHHFFCKLLP